MTPSHLATLVSLFILLVGAIYVFARPDEVMAADRELPMVSYKVNDGAEPLQVAQADHSSEVAASRKETTRSHHLVILFHGIRGRGSVMEAIGNSWKATLPDTVFVAPDAPFQHRSGGRQWFAVDDQVMRPERIDAARRAFDGVVSDIIKREGFEGALDRVAFAGVSQGAIMALDGVASGRWKVGALVTFAGLLPFPPTSSSTQTDILMMHGSADKTIPPAATTVASSQLKSVGFAVRSKIYRGVGHTISTEEARDAVNFLRDGFK
ncbi:dienelactone hydrolase family protein [uncultured Agrobacterium sp.]|uniref:alpha/beta hydrolase n=1 Tax=uncultured Agrobacterium sp. TaxID=157277 RepID=UPI00258D91E6|nr:dienelactone hydrolase family protein [uncultured Agrobacterium sp.]